jgi:hypothetical protein
MMELWDLVQALNVARPDLFRDFEVSEDFTRPHKTLYEAQAILEASDELASLSSSVAKATEAPGGIAAFDDGTSSEWNSRWWHAVQREALVLHELATLKKLRRLSWWALVL